MARATQLETLPGMEPAGAGGPAEGAVGLTEEQEQAVARRAEPLLLSAAAGSGKTAVLVERFVRAVREDGLAPGRILAITFTERAAGELRERVRTRLLALGERQAARDTEAAYVGTFHGFCARLLRTHPLAAEIDPDFAVLEEGLAGRLRQRSFQAAARELLAESPAELTDLLAAYGVDRVGTMIQQAYLELRSRGRRLPRLPRAALAADASAQDVEAAAACLLLDGLLHRFGLLYEASKRDRAALDFDDLELLAQQLLGSRASIREAWSERFELLMVDEFQDTNPRQLAILQALDRDNLFTVGDEFQSIYGFRHADVELFRARRSELETAGGSLSLTRNFRSRAPLLSVVNELFGERFTGFPELVAGRVDPPTPDGEPAVELLLTGSAGWEQREQLAGELAASLPPGPCWRQAEARLLAGRVRELVDSGRARAGEIVVLLRSAGDLETFERALQLRGLRTLAAVGAFWGDQQIGDLIAYLRALANPLDEEAFYGLLASPLGGCSRDCLALLAQAAQSARSGAWAQAAGVLGGEQGLAQRLAVEDRLALEAICGLLASERAGASRHTIAELLERAVAASGYRTHVLALDWGERRLANVHKLLRLARRFERSEGRDLRAFLDYVEYLREAAQVEPDAPVEGVEPDAVRLMTVHAAKGLEFPVVCLADLGRAPNTRTPDLLLDGERIGVRLMRLDGEGSTPALEYEQLAAERRRREAEEEDRILYVAMTRARELLLLSGSLDFDRWPRPGFSAPPVAWLAAALSEDLPGMIAARQAPVWDLLVGSALVRCRLNTVEAPAGGVGAAEPAGAAGPPAVDDPPSRSPVPAAAPASLADRSRAPATVPETRRAARGPVAEAPSAAQAPMDTLSYTSLSELERCGYRYYLERVLGLGEERVAVRREPGEQGLEARARGTLVHALMESLDFADPRPPSSQELAEHARELGLRVSAGETQELLALVAASCRAALLGRVAAASSVRREHPFAFSLAPGEPLINGAIDLLAVETDGSRLVLDYKSDRVAPGADLERLVEREYAIQRLIYALAVLRDGAPAVEIVHWFLEREQWVTARYGAGERVVLEQALAERIASARGHGFAVSPEPHRGLCLTCPGRVGLCSWDEAQTLREHP